MEDTVFEDESVGNQGTISIMRYDIDSNMVVQLRHTGELSTILIIPSLVLVLMLPG